MKFIKTLPLIGIATTTVIMPLVACTSNNKYELVQIDLDHIKDIVGLKDVQFLQDEELTYGPSGMQWAKEWMSPTVFHGIASGDVEAFERYLWYNESTLMMTERSSSQSWQWTDPKPTTQYQFRTPPMVGNAFVERCNLLELKRIELTFDEDKLCYSASFSLGEQISSFEFYFLNNKLVRFVDSFKIDSIGAWGVTIFNLSYVETSPVLPIDPSF